MAKATADIRSLARAHTQMGINVLASVARQRKAPAAARVAAVTELFNRGWGKAQQTTTVDGDIRVTIRHILEHIDETPMLEGESVRRIDNDTSVVEANGDNSGCEDE